MPNDSERETLRRFAVLSTGGSGYGYYTMTSGAVTQGDLATVIDVSKPVQSIERKKIRTVLKKKHLDRLERQSLHNPINDWQETKNGEICKSASTLFVEDIISKYK